MNSFAKRSAKERAEVFEETAVRKGIARPAIIEKDFWVCWTLGELFGSETVSNGVEDPPLLFKGGTSLSKVFHLIDRFSEDVDLTLGHSLVLPGALDPDEVGISNRERKRRIEAIVSAAKDHVQGPILKSIQSRFEAIGGQVTSDKEDPQTLHCAYPKGLESRAYATDGYVNASIRLEFGAKGGTWPAEQGTVHPYAAEEFPDLFDKRQVSVWALSPLRTFWEKATILHSNANSGKLSRGDRQSRHYSDLAVMSHTDIGQNALKQIELLEIVSDHKEIFFPSPSAKYDLARPGTLRLIPDKDLITILQSDYNDMSEMFIGESLAFDEVMGRLSALEKIINADT